MHSHCFQTLKSNVMGLKNSWVKFKPLDELDEKLNFTHSYDSCIHKII